MKTEVYSWRMSPEMKEAIEREARREGNTVADVLDQAVRSWLEEQGQRPADEKEHARRRAAAMRWIGSLAGGEPRRAERARELVKAKVAKRCGR